MEIYRQELLTSALEPSPELIEVQALMPIDPADRERLKEDIAKDGIRDAIKVYKNGNKYYILGGYNRWRIAQELGITSVPVEIYHISEKERRDLVIKDNLNRRHLTRDQKQKLIEYFLRLEPEKSDRAIAKKTGSDHKTVGSVRRELESTGEIPQLGKRVGIDDKVRLSKINKSNISKKDVETPKKIKSSEVANLILEGAFDYYDLRKLILTALEECLRSSDKQSRIWLIKEVKELMKRFS
jgi:ParB-like chromosome segregation protein Spo0J